METIPIAQLPALLEAAWWDVHAENLRRYYTGQNFANFGWVGGEIQLFGEDLRAFLLAAVIRHAEQDEMVMDG